MIAVATEERRAFFTPAELAKYLNIGRSTLYEMLAQGIIPSYRVQGRRRIDPQDVDAYLARNRAEGTTP